MGWILFQMSSRLKAPKLPIFYLFLLNLQSVMFLLGRKLYFGALNLKTIRHTCTEVGTSAGLHNSSYLKFTRGSKTYCAHENALSRAAKVPPIKGAGGLGSCAIHHPTGILTAFIPCSDRKRKSSRVTKLFLCFCMLENNKLKKINLQEEAKT